MIDGNESDTNVVTFRKCTETGNVNFGNNETDLGYIETVLDVTWDEDDIETETEYFMVNIEHAGNTHVVSIFERMVDAVDYSRKYCLLLRAASHVMIHMDALVFTDRHTTQEITLTDRGSIRRMTRLSVDRAVAYLQNTVPNDVDDIPF